MYIHCILKMCHNSTHTPWKRERDREYNHEIAQYSAKKQQVATIAPGCGGYSSRSTPTYEHNPQQISHGPFSGTWREGFGS